MIPEKNLDTRTARLVLNALPNVGPVTCRRLFDNFGNDAASVFRASKKQLLEVKGVGEAIADTIENWRCHFNPEREIENMKKRGVRFVLPADGASYPPLLNEIYDPPLGLYMLGDFHWGDRCVAIIGSRRTTPYGREMAKHFARDLAKAGWCIVSGLARGIDAVAHQGALDAGGATCAVLGCGIDIVYPPENISIYQEIARSGAIFTEFTLGRKADKQTFPQRNRIVAGMCRAIIVIESDNNGGSMITARFAAEQNRLVCALPGRADLETSRGCHALIRDGATLVTSADEILEELGEGAQKTAQNELDFSQKTPMPELAPEEKNLWQHFAGGATHSTDTLSNLTGLPVSSLMGTLLMMELKKVLTKNDAGRYEAAVRF